MRDVVGRFEVLDKRVERELDALAAHIRQRFLRIVELDELHGFAAFSEKYRRLLLGLST